MTLALSSLCENPNRRSGLSTLFEFLVSESVEYYPNLHWIVFAGEGGFGVDHPRVQVDRSLPANDQLGRRLFADHFLLSRRARAAGAEALVTVGFVPLLAAVPTVVHVLSLHHFSAREMPLPRRIYRMLVSFTWRRARLVIANSECTRRELVERFPRLDRTTIVSYEGLDHRNFRPSRPDADDQALAAQEIEPGYILWVSNFYAYKRADQLLRGLALLPQSLRAKHPLVLVGGDWRGGRHRAIDLADELGVADTTRFLGWVDDADIPALYRNASALAFASDEETFGRSVVEAMACGTPCLVSALPIMEEVTRGAAMLVDFSDPDTVATELERILTDGTLRDRLRREGLAVAAAYDFAKLARERVDAILQRVIGVSPQD